MMRLDTMRALTATLNEHGQSAIADQLLAHWAHDPGSAEYYRSSANFLFMFTHAGQPYALRFNHARERTVEQIEAELAYVEYLSECGVPVAPPVRSLQGKLVEPVDTPLGRYYASVFCVLPGKQWETHELTLGQFTRWGRALGELHTAAQGYQRAGRPTWQDHLALIAAGLPPTEHVARQALAQIEHELRNLPMHAQNFGLIHYDFELDNLIWTADHIGLLDFDDCAWYWFAADVAYALRDLYADDPTQVDWQHPAVLAFVAGYRTSKAISQEELQLMPLFLRLHNLLKASKLLRSLDYVAQPEDPDWLGELAQKLRRKANVYRQGFAQFVP
jgi:Ser/Thr protein kinase RdoA (MazF antagonist)